MQLTLDTLVPKLASAIASAALVGGGTVVLTQARTNAIQDEQISGVVEREKRRDDVIDRLTNSVNSLDKNVAVLNERLKNK